MEYMHCNFLKDLVTTRSRMHKACTQLVSFQPHIAWGDFGNIMWIQKQELEVTKGTNAI